jgi:hypothetical protein
MTLRYPLFVGTLLACGVATLNGQSQTSRTPDKPFTATGCVARAVNDGSLAGSPGVPPADPSRAPVLANTAEPTGAYLLNSTEKEAEKSASAAGTQAPDAPRRYVLDGSANQIEPHVGHQIEVTGTLVASQVGAAGETSKVDHIKVDSVRMVSANCPDPASDKN